MIHRVAPPLRIDKTCRQVSCHFDESLFQEDTACQLGLALPDSLNGAVQKRKAEFLAGRYCAREALAQLGCRPGTTGPGTSIGIGAHREPLWPTGFVGSITHTQGYASALVARSNLVRAVGVDSEAWIEPDRADGVSPQILTTGESHGNYLHLFASPMHHLTMVFSAKESVFKCLFPLVHRFFDFHAAIITPIPSESTVRGEFRFELLEDLDDEFRAGYRGHGCYSIHSTGVHTAVILTPKSPVQ